MLGVGGNLVAVQASRLSTALHQQGKPGEFRNDEEYHTSTVCPNPYKVFCSKSINILFVNNRIILVYFSNIIDNNSSATRVLLFMAIPGHLTFVFLIWQLAADHIRLSILFIILYLIATLIQVEYFLY